MRLQGEKISGFHAVSEVDAPEKTICPDCNTEIAALSDVTENGHCAHCGASLLTKAKRHKSRRRARVNRARRFGDALASGVLNDLMG